MQDYDKKLGATALSCLESLGGIFNRKAYIPGETVESQKIRTFFMAQGGIAAIWMIYTLSLDPELKKAASEGLLCHVSFKEWGRQVEMLRKLQNHSTSNLASSRVKDELISHRNNKIFYKSSEVFYLEKAFSNTVLEEIDNNLEIDKIVSLPR